MKKLLIIEDDVPLRDNISEVLALVGYEIISAEHGKSGVEMALKEKPDLILCDIVMPELDGYGVLHILSRHPETVNIPFIFLSGRKELSELRKAMALGADDYIVKPFKDTDLMESIEMRLKKSTQKQTSGGTQIGDVSSGITALAEKRLGSREWEVNRYNRKYIVYTNGDSPKAAYFVVSGKLKEYTVNKDGKELILNIYSKGDLIGYREIIANCKYWANLQAIEDAELMLIPKKSFLDLVDTDQKVEKELIRQLCHNIREQEERLINLAYNSLRKKVANAIVKVADKFKDSRDGKPSIEISREDLSHFIGSAPESMIRTLKEFKQEKLIGVSNGYITLLNEGRLRALRY